MLTDGQSILLDTHVFIWALEQVNKLGPETQAILQSGQTVYVSVASLWELAIKHKAGKFPYTTDKLVSAMELSGFKLLPINPAHLQSYPAVELAHKDPFDSLLVAQAKNEKALLISADSDLLQSTYEPHNARS